jgi:Holliday junction DNA helicase RuvA
MIARLTGKLIEKLPAYVVIDVNGVGFEVLITGRTFERLPENGNVVSLDIHTHVREDEIKLIGFQEKEDKEIFLKLTGVSGISVKTALSSLSIYSASELKRIIIKKEVDLIRRIPGVGKKLAERLIIEIRDRLDEQEPQAGYFMPEGGEKLSEVRLALKTLGYSSFEINEVLKKVNLEKVIDSKTEEILKIVLREM